MLVVNSIGKWVVIEGTGVIVDAGHGHLQPRPG